MQIRLNSLTDELGGLKIWDFMMQGFMTLLQLGAGNLFP
jgi:hypothetical protein